MPDEQIRATLGHEFGHLAHKDTDLILLISVGNMFVNMLVTFFNIGLWFFDIITTIMCLFMCGEDGFITHLFMIFSRFLAVITVNLLLRIWTGLGTLLVMKSSRGNEFEADEFAFQLDLETSCVHYLIISVHMSRKLPGCLPHWQAHIRTATTELPDFSS